MANICLMIESLEKRAHFSVSPVTLATVPNLGGNIAVDAAGDVFGTTSGSNSSGSNASGSNSSGGTVFEIPAGSNTVQTIASFGANTGSNPLGIDPGTVLVDSAGNLFGTSTSQTASTPVGFLSADGPGYYDYLPDSEVWELKKGASQIQVLATLDPGAVLTAVDSADDVFGTGAPPYAVSWPTYYAFRCTVGGDVTYLKSADYDTPTYSLFADSAGDAVVSGISGVASAGNEISEIPAGQSPDASDFSFVAQSGLIGVDSVGNLYLFDYSNKLSKYAPGSQTPTFQVTPPSEALGGPTAVDPAGDVYALANPNILAGDALQTERLVELPAGSTTFRTLESDDSVSDLAKFSTDLSGDLFAVTTAGTILEYQGVGSIAPVITSLSTSTAFAGQRLTLDVAGTATNFVQGQTTASLGAGITVDSVDVIDPTHVQIVADVSSDATVGSRSLTLTTGSLVAVDEGLNVVAPAAITVSGPGGIIPLMLQGSDAVFTVSIPMAQAGDVTVQFTTVDGSAIAGTDYSATSGTATIPAGQTSTTIDVPLKSTSATRGNVQFSVSLSNPSDNAVILTGTAVATLPAVTVISGPANAAKPLTYVGSNGATVRLLLHGPGTATAYFAGDPTSPAAIEITGTTARSSITVVTSRNQMVSIGGFDVESPLGLLSAPDTILTGNSVFTSAVSHIVLGDNETPGDSLTLHGSGTVTIAGKSLDGLSIISAQPIRTLDALSFASGSIVAPSLESLTVKQNLGADISAGAIGNISIHGELADSQIRSQSSIGSIVAGAMTRSTIDSSVAGNAPSIPNSAADFTNASGKIGVLVCREKDGFSSTTIAAPHLGAVEINGATATDGGTVISEQIAHFAFSEKGHKPVKFSNSKSGAKVPEFEGTDFALVVI